MKIKLNVVSAHITALLGAAFSVVALAHPGFTEPAVVQSIGVTLPIVIAGAVEAYHLLTHRQIQAALAVAASTVQNAEAAAKTPAPAPTPAPPAN